MPARTGKSLCILLALHMLCLHAVLAFAGENRSDQDGELTLTDNSGRPGVKVEVARQSVVAYTGAVNAAGYGGTAGQVMCCVAGHPDADPYDALYFAVRASQMADQIKCPDDSAVYQRFAGGEHCSIEQCEAYMTQDISEWYAKPGGSGS